MIIKLFFYIKYQILYYIIGFVAILEDIFGRSKNKCGKFCFRFYLVQIIFEVHIYNVHWRVYCKSHSNVITTIDFVNRYLDLYTVNLILISYTSKSLQFGYHIAPLTLLFLVNYFMRVVI